MPLTPRQRRVVEAPLDRCVVVNAGPGTGKTHVLVERFLHLVEVRGLGLQDVLVVTFGREAAREVKERIARRLLEAGRIRTTLELDPAWIANFHGLCHRLLRENGLVAAFDPVTRIIDQVESIEVALRARDRLLDSDLASRAAEAEAQGTPLLAGVVDRLSYRIDHAVKALGRAKENILGVTEALRGAERALSMLADVPEDERRLHASFAECLPAVEAHYEALKARGGLVDFVDLQVRAVRFLESPSGRRQHGRFKALLVDELQDTNHVQMRLLELLAGDRLQAVMGVGDERQAIYAFRGARVDNIRELPARVSQRQGPCDVLDLTESYRSYQEILDLSRHVLPPATSLAALEAAALGAAGDDPCAHRPVVRVMKADTKASEGEWIADRVARLRGREVTTVHGDGTRQRLPLTWGHFAILMRGVRSAREYEDALRARGIPYRTIGGTGFYDRREVLDLIAYLRAIANPYDGLALVRVLQNPPFGLSDRSLHGLANLAARRSDEPDVEVDAHEHKVVPGFRLRPFDAIRRALDDPATARSLGLGESTLARLERLSAFLQRGIARRGVVPVSRLLQDVLSETGYGKLLLADQSRGPAEALRRRKNVERLLRMARRHEERHVYGSLDELVRYLNRAIDEELQEEEEAVEADDRVVSIMTVHKAKGLEWPVVFVAGMTDRSWPMRGFPDEVPFFDPGGIVLRTGVVGEDDGGKVRYPETKLHAHLAAQGEATREDEERRILFVAMTRAKNLLHLSGHGSRTRYLDEVAARLPGEQASEPEGGETLASPAADTTSAPMAIQASALDAAIARALVPPDPSEVRVPEIDRTRHTRLSFTQVDAFVTCPLRYKFTYVLPLPAVRSGPIPTGIDGAGTSIELAPVDLGTILHEALERWAHDERPLEHIVSSVVREHGWSGLAPADERRIERFVRGFLDSPLGRDRPTADEVEVAFSLRIERSELIVTVTGAIDRIVPGPDDAWSVFDYKTSHRIDARRYRLQLSIYRMAMERVLGRRVGACFAYFVQHPASEGLVEVATLPPDETEHVLLAIGKKILDRRFALDEHPGPETCWRCPFGGRDGPCPERAMTSE